MAFCIALYESYLSMPNSKQNCVVLHLFHVYVYLQYSVFTVPVFTVPVFTVPVCVMLLDGVQVGEEERGGRGQHGALGGSCCHLQQCE